MSDIVSRLVRAAASIPTDISDTDLDRHVAELLAREAKEKEGKWKELGLSAYLDSSGRGSESPNSALPKPNKRFLSSIIRTVDDHNASLLKEQADAARQARRSLYGSTLDRDAVRRERNPYEEADQRIRRRRERDGDRQGGREDGERGAMRMFSGALGATNAASSSRSGVGSSGSPRRRNHREREEERPRGDKRDPRRYEEDYDTPTDSRVRTRDDDIPSFKRRHEAQEDDDSRSRHKRDDAGSSRRPVEEDDARKSRREDRVHEPTTRRSRRKDEREGSRSVSNERNTERRRSRRDEKNLSSTTSHQPELEQATRPTAASGAGEPPAAAVSIPTPPSKMDKYFAPTYDPRLDFSAVLPVPSTGLVHAASSGEVGWDAMLSVLKSRGKKGRRNSPGLEDELEDGGRGAGGRATSSRRRSVSPPSRDRHDVQSDTDNSISRHRSEKKSKRRSKRRSPSSESSDTRERRKRRKRKEKERSEREEEEKRVEGLGGYVYAKRGVGTREWDVGKETPT